MNTLENYAPTFYGKNAIEKLNTWNTLLSDNDFAALITNQKSALIDYIGILRKAEVFKQCACATAELKRLKAFISWEENYSLDYNIYTTLSYPCGNVDELIAYSNQTLNVTLDWVVSEFREWYGGDCLEWELSERYDETAPGKICISCLELVSVETAQPVFSTKSID